jgi:hypothetical protein
VLYVAHAERLVRGARTVDRVCLVRGTGRHEVELSVAAGQCGWSRDGSMVRLNVYLQYDTYVQQVPFFTESCSSKNGAKPRVY